MFFPTCSSVISLKPNLCCLPPIFQLQEGREDVCAQIPSKAAALKLFPELWGCHSLLTGFMFCKNIDKQGTIICRKQHQWGRLQKRRILSHSSFLCVEGSLPAPLNPLTLTHKSKPIIVPSRPKEQQDLKQAVRIVWFWVSLPSVETTLIEPRSLKLLLLAGILERLTPK